MKTTLLATSLLALTSGAALADGPSGISGYALANDGATLLVMQDLGAPGETMMHDLEMPVKALAWRPVTGELLGFANGRIAQIDPATGKMTDLEATFLEGTEIDETAVIALDFNNQIDAVRAVSSAGDNLVYFPDGFGDGDERAGSVRRFTELAYAEDDPMAGASPQVFANAYTNAINGMTAASTFQYALDAETDALISLANNAGTLATIGRVTVDGAEVDLAPVGGFDITSRMEGEDTAFAILQMEGAATAGLYEIDLETAAARLVADLGMGGISGFAAALQP